MEDVALNTAFNGFDIAVLAVIAISAIIAFFRGFVREILSLIAWALAASIAFISYKPASKLLAPYISTEALAMAVAGVGIFIGLLIIFAIINMLVANAIRKTGISGIDRSLGFAFGLLRGAFIISLGYYMFTLVLAKEDHPEWLTTAKTGRLVEVGAGMLANAAPEYTEQMQGQLRSLYKKKADTNAAPVDQLLDRTAFQQVLSKNDRAAIQEILASIPTDQRPVSVRTSMASLSDSEAASVLLQLIRIQRQLHARRIAQADATKPLSGKQMDAKRVAEVEGKLKYLEQNAAKTAPATAPAGSAMGNLLENAAKIDVKALQENMGQKMGEADRNALDQLIQQIQPESGQNAPAP